MALCCCRRSHSPRVLESRAPLPPHGNTAPCLIPAFAPPSLMDSPLLPAPFHDNLDKPAADPIRAEDIDSLRLQPAEATARLADQQLGFTLITQPGIDRSKVKVHRGVGAREGQGDREVDIAMGLEHNDASGLSQKDSSRRSLPPEVLSAAASSDVTVQGCFHQHESLTGDDDEGDNALCSTDPVSSTGQALSDATSAPSTTTPVAIDQAEVHRKPTLCSKCLLAPVDCVLLDCGHMVTCTGCAQNLTECPACRQFVKRTVHAYRA